MFETKKNKIQPQEKKNLNDADILNFSTLLENINFCFSRIEINLIEPN